MKEKSDSNQKVIFANSIKEHKPEKPKQEDRIKELECCVTSIEEQLDNITNEADIKMYASMKSEYKNLIYTLKQQ